MSLPPAAASPARRTSRSSPIAPGSPERAELKARLASMAAERDRHPAHHRRQGDPHRQHRQGGDAAQARARAGARGTRPAPERRRQAVDAAPRRASRVGQLAVRGPRRGVPQRRRAARHHLARHAQRRDHAGPVEDRLSGGNRRRLRAGRLLALQRRLRRGAARRAADSRRTAIWNQTDYRPLEGFVYAVSPFNFTAIGGNLPTAPALMGNTVVWKPAATAMLLAYYIDAAARGGGPAAGRDQLRARAIRSMISTIAARRTATSRGIHFTGSTGVFNSMWQHVGENLGNYRSYPAPRRRDRRQGLHRRAPVGRSAGSGGGRSCAAPSSTRARSARRPAASTCRKSLWPEMRDRDGRR